MKTKEEIAYSLNGREYGNEVTDAESEWFAKNGFLVVYGSSDDCTEFRGIIKDELSAYGGENFLVYQGKKLKVCSEDIFIDKFIDDDVNPPKTIGIDAIWSPKDPDCSWLITSEVPHATFDIMEEGELFCRGAVFHIDDIEKMLSQ